VENRYHADFLPDAMETTARLGFVARAAGADSRVPLIALSQIFAAATSSCGSAWEYTVAVT